jgi:hypothetical protein
LDSGFVDPFLERTHLSLHLLHIRTGVGKSPSHRVQIRLHSAGVVPHPSLLALDEIDLLGSDAANDPACYDGQKITMKRFHGKTKPEGAKPQEPIYL